MTFTVLYSLLSISYLLAKAGGIAFSLMINFLLQRHWTFRVNHRPVVRQFLAFLASTIVYLGLSSLVLWALVEYVLLPAVPAKVITIGVMFGWNFFIARQVVFKFF